MAKMIKSAIVSNNGAKKSAQAVSAPVAAIFAEMNADPTPDQVKAWWPNARGIAILEMMDGGLPYFRAVKRSRRYFLEGKLS